MNIQHIYKESDLIKMLAAGDEPAFNEIYRQYRANIYTTALRMTSSTVLAEEVVQDVFLNLWRARATVGQIVSVKAYLHGIAAHVIFDALKRKYREKEKERRRLEIPVQVIDTDTEDAIIYKDYQSILARAIHRLPNKQRQTYILIKQDGLKREEVARKLNVSPETVKWNLEQAMKSIRDYCSTHLNISITIFFLLFNT